MQFSLQTMMLLLFVAALICATMFSFPIWLTMVMWMLAFTVLPSLLVIMIVYGGIEQRAFGIGAMTAFGFAMLYTSELIGWRSSPYRSFSAILWLLILVVVGVSGWGSVQLRRWLAKQEDRL